MDKLAVCKLLGEGVAVTKADAVKVDGIETDAPDEGEFDMIEEIDKIGDNEECDEDE